MTPISPAADSAWKGRRWIACVFALILLNMTICAVTVYAARVSQPPIERGYDDKALKWDLSNKQREVNRTLGWRAVYGVERRAHAASPLLVITLLDSSGRPIRTADCTARVYADISPDIVHHLQLTSHDDGTYSALLPRGASGWFDIAMSVEAAGMRFVDSSRISVPTSVDEVHR